MSFAADLLISRQQPLAVDIPLTFATAELARLCRALENAGTPGQCLVVQFASAHAGEGASVIAFEAAAVAAMLLGKRVLYIDSHAARYHAAAKDLAAAVDVPIDTHFDDGAPGGAMVAVEHTKLWFARLHSGGSQGGALPDMDGFQSILAAMRPSFDLIVIDSPDILTHVSGGVLAKLCDGTLLVIEAERTRAPVALEAVRMIEFCGGRVLGAALNRRRHYIPAWLYRFLYARKDASR